ncbi:transcription complex subunit 6-like [Seminavis robusta]|uniref:Transcription complex subunit 6-like n=1 Tax=Seminavis robusta TaxID=568900 RepID=A0A9N8DYN4_9STRA|nr:transcription complex subunit 6-like [Seminavis robusta]|eukprot:Sro470_g149550.1 transcription complex subunit 6-like (754) ;mRNA; r:35827-38088
MAATTPSFPTASLSSWTGWVVPRILPSETNNNNDSINAMAEKCQIDPSSLCPGRGRESHPFATNSKAHATCMEDEGPLPPSSQATAQTQTTVQLLDIDEKSELTSLDIYLFPPDNSNNGTNPEEPLHVRMQRSSQEMVNHTLQRMALSINKQLTKRFNRSRKKTKLQKGQQTKSSPLLLQADSGVILQADSIIPMTKRTNQQVWSQAASTPTTVQLQLEDSSTLSLPVEACPPTIISVATFEDFGARVFCHVPLVVQVQSMFASHVVVDWYVGDQLVLQDSATYTPQSADDIGKKISILVTPVRSATSRTSHHTGCGYEQAYQFQHVIEALPENTAINVRRGDLWTDPDRRQRLQDSPAGPIRVVTYNILADQNAYERNTHAKQVPCRPYVSLATLDKARRMPLILHELLSYQADILCLQEVDENIWKRLFRPTLEQMGYQGFFSNKVAKGMSEGCAMLWSLHRFEKIPEEEMKHYGLADLIQETIQSVKSQQQWKSATAIGQVLQEKQHLRNVIENKLGHVVQMALLPLRSNNNDRTQPDRILLANTHLFYHPYGAHIRLMQMYAICQQLERSTDGVVCPMILCGDLNSSLRRAAGYLLIHRQVQSTHTQIREHFNTFHWKDRDDNVATVGAKAVAVGGSVTAMRIENTEKDKDNDDWEDFPTIELPPHFPTFKAGYETEPEFTHYLDSFKGSLDHIFVSQPSQNSPFGLEPFQAAPMPSVELVTEQIGMPSEKFPSDHISLVADLKFTSYS